MTKCGYQLDDCHNWSDAGLTLGYSQSWMGPKDSKGRSTLVNVAEPICPACVATNPTPMRADPGLPTMVGDGPLFSHRITVHRTERLPGLGVATLAFSDDYPGYQFLIFPDNCAATILDDLR